MADIDKLIADLSTQAAPLKPMPHPFVSFLKWTLSASVYLAVLMAFNGLRGDLMLKLHTPLFLAEIASLAAMILASTLSAAVLSFPDLYQKRWAAYAPIVPLVLLCGVMTLEWIQDIPPSPSPDHSGWECLHCIVFSCLVPACWVFYRLRKMASTHHILAGGVALLGATSIGCMVLRLSEETDSVAHLLEWHYLPALAFSALGLILGKKFLKW